MSLIRGCNKKYSAGHAKSCTKVVAGDFQRWARLTRSPSSLFPCLLLALPVGREHARVEPESATSGVEGGRSASVAARPSSRPRGAWRCVDRARGRRMDLSSRCPPGSWCCWMLGELAGEGLAAVGAWIAHARTAQHKQIAWRGNGNVVESGVGP